MNSSNSTQGWVAEPAVRGTWTIISSSIFTIFLCCWTSVCVNIPAKEETWWDRFCDKFKLASVGILGPDFLVIIAAGQWDSARKSVKCFHAAGYTDWKMKHAFFADMGGIHIQTPESQKSFRITAEQFLYLINKKGLAFSDIETSAIDDKNKSDRLARSITVLQALYFCVNVIIRAVQRLTITTLELTTVAFVISMIFTSLFWNSKPQDISSPLILKVDNTIYEILQQAENEFVDPEEWLISIMWRMYKRLLSKMLLIARPAKIQPTDRIESDNFLMPSTSTEFLTGILMVLYSLVFLAGWRFIFPSKTEATLWKVASIVTVVFTSIGGGLCFILERAYFRNYGLRQQPKTSSRHLRKPMGKFKRIASEIKDFLFDKDIAYGVPDRILIPGTIFCTFYCLARAYILIEDIIGLRLLPSSAFDTVNWWQYIPHL